jgi:hypothetical protein
MRIWRYFFPKSVSHLDMHAERLGMLYRHNPHTEDDSYLNT